MAVGTEIQEQSYSNFDFLKNVNLESQLKIKVELGYLDIPERSKFAAAYVENFSNNQFYPTAGGAQGQSFVNNDILNPNKSQTLSPVVNGIMNQHFEVTGAPYCTFVEGTLTNAQHPYYDLIKGPSTAPLIEASSTLTYAKNNPAILTQFFQQSYSAESKVFNLLGKAFIPSTTLTSNAVAEKKLETLTSYNIWTVENLGGINPADPKADRTKYFNFQGYLGWVPKPGATLDKIQPYAQTVSFSDTAEIQVFASNSQVQLRRLYPMAQDYAHDSKAKYLIYDSTNSSKPDLKEELLKLDKQTYFDRATKKQKKVPATGFVLKFSSVTLNNIPPTAAQGNDTVLAYPQILVSWGRINATESELQDATANNYVCKYTLKLTANSPPTVYFNISDRELTNNVVSPNSGSVVLTTLKGLNVQDGNTGSKSPNSFQIHVYYVGPYMMIGNSQNPGEWQTVAAPTLPLRNGANNTPDQQTIKLRHYLDHESEIRILGQFVNFTYSYGPPLFSPYDPNNIDKFTADIPNTLNYVSGNVPEDSNQNTTGTQTSSSINIDDLIVSSGSNSAPSVPEYILSNAIRTFESVSDYYTDASTDFNPEASAGTTDSNSPIMVDVRAKIDVSDFSYSIVGAGSKFKLTFPKNAGGFVFNNFTPPLTPEPNIKESYTFYDLAFTKESKQKDPVSEILSNSVKKMTITKNVDGDSNSRIVSTLKITFSNLNKTENGLKVLQFMRQNISTLRISAGYKTLYPFFEGMIQKIEVKENLEETIIEIDSNDLLDKLFCDEKTMLLSRQNIKFMGLRYEKAINQMVYYTELHNHFKYALGEVYTGEFLENDTEQTLATAFRRNKYYRLPKIDPSSLDLKLAKLEVGAYSTKNTYFGVLKTIKNISTQIKTEKSSKSIRFDVPIFYWYTSGSSNEQAFQGTKEIVKGNGIVMSSRTLDKDKDTFYLSRKSISPGMIKDINELHCLLSGNEAFTSTSDSTNLFSEGRYRYRDLQGKPHLVEVKNQNDFLSREKLPIIDNIESYVGYSKIVIFDDPAPFASEIKLGSSLIPDPNYAKFWIERIFKASFTDVYENINLNVFVTKPLKEWGSFRVAFENENGTLTPMPDLYLYNSVSYNFDIDKNLITAVVSASKKPIQALE